MSAPTPAQDPVATARRTGASDTVSTARRGISDAERQATYAAVGSILVLGILDAIHPEIPDTTFSARQAAGADRNRAPGGKRMRRAELDPPQYVLHRCAEHGCPTYAFGSHCERHETPDDRARLATMDAAILRAAELEEAWLAAHREALDAERAAGVRRAEPGYAAVE